MRKVAPFFILFLTFFMLHGFSQNYPSGACASGMGNSSVVVPNIWSTYHNQAGLDYLEQITFGAYFENWFGLSELGLKTAALAVPTKTGTFGLDFSYFGYDKFNEMKMGLAYSKKFADIIAVGIQLDYFNIHQGDIYGNVGIPVAEIGILSEPIDKLFIGAHVFNPWRAQVDDYQNEKMPTVFRIGMGYKFTDKVLMTIETEKDLEISKPIFKSGIEYNFISSLYLRGGISTNPVTTAFGIGYKLKGVSLDLAFKHHQILGYNVGISMYYTFGYKEEKI
jgi:hypothetical protein